MIQGAEILVAVSGLSGAFVTGVFALVMRRLDMQKFNAEVSRVKADTAKIEAETDEIASSRLIRELDRIADINEQQSVLIIQQRAEIDELRKKVLEYAERELNHATEIRDLKRRLTELGN